MGGAGAIEIYLALAGATWEGFIALRYAASEAICKSFNGPPCDEANAGMRVPALPAVIQVRLDQLFHGPSKASLRGFSRILALAQETRAGHSPVKGLQYSA